MDRADALEVGAVFLVEIIQIGLVLKEIGVQLSLFQRFVGQDVVGKFLDLQHDALLFQQGFGRL